MASTSTIEPGLKANMSSIEAKDAAPTADELRAVAQLRY